MADVEFAALIGEHELSGVDFESVRNDGDWGDANVMRFVLDSQIYVATEDPDDGYRSSLRSLEIVDGPPVKNTFGPVRVVCSHRTVGSYAADDVLEFRDLANGNLVLEVGTDATDDYYPSFVANFSPDKLAINATRGDAQSVGIAKD